MPGVYLRGACTHPGGSVIAINGRNAAMAVLADIESGAAAAAVAGAGGTVTLAGRSRE